MLILSRKLYESIKIGDNITVTIVKIAGQVVRVGISAPDHVKIIRSELEEEPKQ